MKLEVNQLGKVIVLLVALGSLASGCATVGSESIEEKVAQRAQQRWDALLAGEIDLAYQFLSPARRSAIGLMDYQRQVFASRVRWVAADVGGVSCGADVCEAVVNLKSTVISPVPGVRSFDVSRNVTENWVLADHQWWYVPE